MSRCSGNLVEKIMCYERCFVESRLQTPIAQCRIVVLNLFFRIAFGICEILFAQYDQMFPFCEFY